MAATDIREPAECPECGGASTKVTWSTARGYSGSYVEYCPTCIRARDRRAGEFRSVFERLLPTVSERTKSVFCRNWDAEPGGLDALLRASDAELLQGRMVGPKMLAEFRDAVRQAGVTPETLAELRFGGVRDDWAEHAVMMTGG